MEQTILQKYVDNRILGKVDKPTPWIFNMVIKHTGSKVHLCLNLSQTVNKAIRRIKYQIPPVEEHIYSLQKVKCFSIVNVNVGFTNIRLDHDSYLTITMMTSYRRYRWLWLPFGIEIGIEEFQKRLHDKLGLKNILNIVDGILIYRCGEAHEEASKDHDIHFFNRTHQPVQRD